MPFITHSRLGRSLAVVALAAISLAFVSSAAAAPSAPATAPAPASPSASAPEVDAQLWPSEPEGAVLIVAGTPPAEAKLPYTVRLPLPSAVQTITWAGEIASDGSGNDLERTFKIEDGAGGKVLVLTLEKDRMAQYEAFLGLPAADGKRFVSRLDWVQSVPASRVAFSVKFAADAADVSIQPAAAGAPQTNGAGEHLYALTPTVIETGKSFSLTASFVRGASPAPAANTAKQGPAWTDIALVVLGALLVFVVAALIIQLWARRPAQLPAEQPEDDGERPAAEPREPSNEPFDLD